MSNLSVPCPNCDRPLVITEGEDAYCDAPCYTQFRVWIELEADLTPVITLTERVPEDADFFGTLTRRERGL